jgi:hypothetical protein
MLSAVELLEAFPQGRGFKNSEAADAFLREERDSWER